MPLIEIKLVEGRSAEAKRDLIVAVTDATEKAIGAPRKSIRVLITEIPPSHWGIGSVPKSEE